MSHGVSTVSMACSCVGVGLGVKGVTYVRIIQHRSEVFMLQKISMFHACHAPKSGQPINAPRGATGSGITVLEWAVDFSRNAKKERGDHCSLVLLIVLIMLVDTGSFSVHLSYIK